MGQQRDTTSTQKEVLNDRDKLGGRFRWRQVGWRGCLRWRYGDGQQIMRFGGVSKLLMATKSMSEDDTSRR